MLTHTIRPRPAKREAEARAALEVKKRAAEEEAARQRAAVEVQVALEAQCARERAAAEAQPAVAAAAEPRHPTAAIALTAAELSSATNGFTGEIGRGAYGVVFCVSLLPSVASAGAVAVKCLFDKSALGLAELQREVPFCGCVTMTTACHCLASASTCGHVA